MMYLNIEGVKSDNCKKLIEDVILYAKDQLMPRIQKLYIDVEVVDGFRDQEGINGEAIHDEDRYATIVIDPDQPFEEFVTTLLHEMVHIKQYVRKELKDGKWKGEYFKGSYADSPWEKEAYELEQTLFEGFLNTQKGAA